MNDARLQFTHRSFALQSALSWPTSAHLRAGWLAAATVVSMFKSLALKASQRIRDVWSDWASDVGHFNFVCGRCIRAIACFADDASRNKFPERILNRFDLPILLVKAFSIRRVLSTHHGAQQGEAARRSSDMRQARHLPQRWYWSIVVQVRDVIRQFTQGTPNCNTNPKATVFGIPKEPVLESAELITSRLTGAGSLLPPVYGEAWAKGHATGTPDSTFPRYGSPHTANMRVRLKNQS
ncbi:hypothetical protein TNCV_3882371 [Trichonephila clavipes]|nr:hypothetical protein TNCV_3882371 [Trichonephila clavipes]